MIDSTSTPLPRRDDVASIRTTPRAQVLVIGGGINGIATFRDLALQGVEVILVERDDYVSGASSASSHMIHGGIRYLENGEFRLVRESVQERNRLLKSAPHCVKPLKTTIPIYSTFSGIVAAPLRFITHKQSSTKERGALLIKVGLTMYDFFSRDGGSVPRHQFRGRKASLAETPALNPGLKYTATYFDASMHDPERLALDVLHDGLAAGAHARSANYVEAVAMTPGGVSVRDRETGEVFDIEADVVINTSGPWTDVTNDALGLPSEYMGGTKGSHIVLDHPELSAALDGRELFFENDDGRIVLIFPLKGRVMVGTTDLEADIREPSVCTEDEVDYFFDLVKNVFPDLVLDRSQIVYRFSGIRPLPKHDETQPGFVSRDYRIEKTLIAERPGSTLLSLVGGKWTTFRALAEHITNDTLALLGQKRRVSTIGLQIGGGVGYPSTDGDRRIWVSANRFELSPERTNALLERYGTRAAAVIQHLSADGDDLLSSSDEYSHQELAYLAGTESIVHLPDLLLRRTSLAFTGSVTAPLLEEVADILASELGWDAHRRVTEIASTTRLLADAHGVHLEALAPGR